MYDLRLCPTIHYGNTDFTRTGDRTPLYGLLKSENFTGHFLLIGEGSIGKTTSLRMLEAELMLEDRPCVLFELKKLNIDASGLSMPASDEFPKGTVVLLDGWDELEDESDREQSASRIKAYMNCPCVAAVVVTSRHLLGEGTESREAGVGATFSRFAQAEVQPYSDEQLKGLLTANGIDTSIMTKPVGSLIRNTMLFSMLIEMNRNDKGRMSEIAEVGLEAPFLLEYFEQLFIYRSVKKPSKLEKKNAVDSCHNALDRIGEWIIKYSCYLEEDDFRYGIDYRIYVMINRHRLINLFQPNGDETYQDECFIPGEFSSIYTFKEGNIVSSHIKFMSLAAAYHLGKMIDNQDYLTALEDISTTDVLPLELPTYFGQLLHGSSGQKFINEVEQHLTLEFAVFDYSSRLMVHIPQDGSIRNCIRLVIGYRRGCLDLSCSWGTQALEAIEDSAYNDYFGGNPYIQQVLIPDGVQIIGDSTFEGCIGLNEILISDSVTEIGESAFMSCNDLKTIRLPDSIREIDYGAFSRCSNLTQIHIPDSVTSIGMEAFAFCNHLHKITIGKNVRHIYKRGSDDYFQESAFENCPITEIILHPENRYFHLDSNRLIENSTGKVIIDANPK